MDEEERKRKFADAADRRESYADVPAQMTPAARSKLAGLASAHLVIAEDYVSSARRIGAHERVAEHDAPDLLDLSVDSAMTERLIRDRFVAYVDVRLPEGAMPHQSLRAWVKQHLSGRNPVVFEEDGWLRTGFAVENHAPATMDKVAQFAVQMGELFATPQVRYAPVRLPSESLELVP